MRAGEVTNGPDAAPDKANRGGLLSKVSGPMQTAKDKLLGTSSTSTSKAAAVPAAAKVGLGAR